MNLTSSTEKSFDLRPLDRAPFTLLRGRLCLRLSVSLCYCSIFARSLSITVSSRSPVRAEHSSYAALPFTSLASFPSPFLVCGAQRVLRVATKR